MAQDPVKPNPPSAKSESHHQQLAELARQAMLDRGLAPDFSGEALTQLKAITGAATDASLRDLRDRLWCSIDNDDSLDLDQISVAEELANGEVRILIGVADVDAVVAKGSPLDEHAQQNTTSVYTAGGIFPMLPERLSTDLTSLGEGQEREALVMDYVVKPDGTLGAESVYRACVTNRAKLAYNSVASWLDGKGPMPAPIARVPGMEQQLRIQDAQAQRLKKRRHEQGALEFQTLAPRAVIQDGQVVALEDDLRNRAKDLIEEFMVAANGVTARFLKAQKTPSMRRIVKTPEHWDRIVTYARDLGETLPEKPDSAALDRFLVARRVADPLRFPDVSLDIVKMMGRGEYVVELPGAPPIGHFGLAVRDYTHSTAPNRRYPDLLTHRLLKAAFANAQPPYSGPELATLAQHCTDQENSADRVERQLRKSAAALLLQSRVGARFEGVVTGAGVHGTWIRVFEPPVEGKLVHGHEGLQIGQRLRAKLISVDVAKGFIDFVKV
jgi:exoribonuclease II